MDGLSFNPANQTNVGLNLWYDNAGNTTSYIDSRYDSSASVMKFRLRTHGTPVEAISILGDGKVGIGMTPTVALDVNGTVKASTQVSTDHVEEVTSGHGVSIKGKTSGAVDAGYIGEVVSYTAVASASISNQTSYTNFGTDHYLTIPSKGTWMVVVTGSCYMFTASGADVSGSIQLYNSSTTTQLAEVQDTIGINVNNQYINSGFSMVSSLITAGAETIRLRGKHSTGSATFAVRTGSRILAVRKG